MIPLYFRLRNFCQQKDTKVDYRFGITGLIGNNGHGKSNLIDAGQFFAWTGQVVKDKKEDYLTWGQSSGSAQVQFQDNNRTYTLTRNLHNAGCTLKWTSASGDTGEEKGIKVVDKILEEDILGMPFEVFREAKFCAQTSLIEILNMTASKRMEYFQKLAGVQRAEQIRGLLQTKSNELPNVMDVSADIKSIEDSVVVAEETVNNAGVALKAWMATLPSEGAVEALGRINQTLKTTRTVDEVSADIVKCIRIVQENTQRIKDLNVDTALVPVDPPTPEETLAAQHTGFITANNKKIEDLTLQASKIAVYQILSKPDTKQVEDFRELLGKQRPLYESAKTGKCETCKRPFEFQEDPKEIIKRFEEAEKVFALASAELKRQQSDYEKNTQDIVRASTSKSGLTRQVAELEADNTRRQASIPSGFALAIYEQKVAKYQTWQSQQAHLNSVQKQVKEYEKAILSAQMCAEQLKKEPELTKEDVEKLTQEKIRIEDALSQISSIQTAQVSAQALILSSKSQLDRLKKQQEQFVLYGKIRGWLESARTYLHRDVLPKFVMSRLLTGMNSCLSYYLARFNAPYNARVDENFQFKVQFKTGPEVSASRLSGGESVALVVAFRFALAELLGKSFPLLVMDEPTAWLDQEKKQVMVDVLKTAKGFAEKGSYVFVVTHDHILLPAMTRTIEVE